MSDISYEARYSGGPKSGEHEMLSPREGLQDELNFDHIEIPDVTELTARSLPIELHYDPSLPVIHTRHRYRLTKVVGVYAYSGSERRECANIHETTGCDHGCI